MDISTCVLSPPATPCLEDTNSSCSESSLLSTTDNHNHQQTRSSLKVSAHGTVNWDYLVGCI